ncbi:hypothetical protein YPPY64_0777 [Yersinia pestis PY-64]|nr:hypothetical protein YPPY06_0821 [Yersinia pestis PY-06]EIS68567.1 hypothetical protein YPPY64_0777 [Yersinia pestis PY-64]
MSSSQEFTHEVETGLRERFFPIPPQKIEAYYELYSSG